MRRIITYLFILLSLICLTSCNTESKTNTKKEIINKTQYTKIKSDKTIHNFGSMKEGEILACNFYIENIGKNNLIINNIETSCGCTIVKWNKKPLRPGKRTKLEVEFNSSSRYGKQYKVISIFANVPNKVYELIITAEVN